MDLLPEDPNQAFRISDDDLPATTFQHKHPQINTGFHRKQQPKIVFLGTFITQKCPFSLIFFIPTRPYSNISLYISLWECLHISINTLWIANLKHGTLDDINNMDTSIASIITYPPWILKYMADHPEKMSFLGLNLNGCSYCEVLADYLGEYGEEYTIRDHSRYRQIIRDEDLGNPRLEQEERTNASSR